MKTKMIVLPVVLILAAVLNIAQAEEESICHEKPEEGPCKARIPRWYYDSEDMKCKKFIYGGCRGNDNNFSNELTCERVCRNN